MSHQVTLTLPFLKLRYNRLLLKAISDEYKFSITEKRRFLWSKFILEGDDIPALETLTVMANTTKMAQFISFIMISVWAAIGFTATRVLFYGGSLVNLLYAVALMVVIFYSLNKMYINYHIKQQVAATIRCAKLMGVTIKEN